LTRASCAPTSTAPGRGKKGADQAIGRSKGGLSTKIHATVDALGDPTGFHRTGGQACDLEGADVLLPQLEADTLLADKGFDAHQRVLIPWQEAGKVVVIPSPVKISVSRPSANSSGRSRAPIPAQILCLSAWATTSARSLEPAYSYRPSGGLVVSRIAESWGDE
jgi:hypothetical protein